MIYRPRVAPQGHVRELFGGHLARDVKPAGQGGELKNKHIAEETIHVCDLQAMGGSFLKQKFGMKVA